MKCSGGWKTWRCLHSQMRRIGGSRFFGLPYGHIVGDVMNTLSFAVSISLLKMNRLLTKALKPVPRTRSSFSSALNIPATSPRPEFFNSVKITNSDGVTYCSIPVFRLLDSEGTRLSTVDKEWSDQLDAVSPGVLLKLYRTMLMLPALARISLCTQAFICQTDDFIIY